MARDSDSFSKKPSGSRPLKVGEAIRHALADVFMRGETHVVELDSASITVSEVRVSPDLKNATAYVMPLAGGHKEEILALLGQHAAHLRHLVAGKLALKYMPRIHYKLDDSYEAADRMNRLLHSPDVVKDLE